MSYFCHIICHISYDKFIIYHMAIAICHMPYDINIFYKKWKNTKNSSFLRETSYFIHIKQKLKFPFFHFPKFLIFYKNIINHIKK